MPPPRTVYLECALMANNELLHYGHSLGFMSSDDRTALETDTLKLPKTTTPIVNITRFRA